MNFWTLLLVPILAYCFNTPIYRQPSDPFVSGDTFRAHSDFVYDDEDKSFDPASVRDSQVIFVKTDFIGEFFEKIHPQIQARYILICHNSDHPSPGEHKAHLDDPKIIAWFALNYDGTIHPKLHPIPFGIANRIWPWGNADTLKKVMEKTKGAAKQHLLYMNFTIQNYYDERWPVFRQFAQAPFIFRTGKKLFEPYLHDLASTRFVLAPRGAGIDTYRIWESVYLGVIPIVRTSTVDCIYEGLPILIIKDWKEVTEAFLKQKDLEFSQKTFSLDKLDISYWLNEIEQCKRR